MLGYLHGASPARTRAGLKPAPTFCGPPPSWIPAFAGMTLVVVFGGGGAAHYVADSGH